LTIISVFILSCYIYAWLIFLGLRITDKTFKTTNREPTPPLEAGMAQMKGNGVGCCGGGGARVVRPKADVVEEALGGCCDPTAIGGRAKENFE
jgi:hypothetical protein